MRWSHALATGTVVAPDSYTQMTTPVRLNDGREWFYGMGLVLNTFEGHRAVEHTGNISGFTSVLVQYPDDDLSVAVTTNLGYTLAASAIKQHISRRLLGLAEPKFRDLPLSIAERARYLGVYEAGGFWFEILEDGERLTFVMRGPGFDAEPWVAFREPHLYQGEGHFVAADKPDVIQVWFDQPGASPGEISVTIAGSGWRPQAIRIHPSAALREERAVQ